MLYDLIIIGGGPAGVGAGVYASRKRIRTAFIAKEIAGQSSVSAEIQNWIGDISLSGNDLAKKLKAHLLAYAGGVLDIKEGELVESFSKNERSFSVKTNKGVYEARAILIATGSKRRRLVTLGADKFEHKGVTYCASCDGPMFAGMDLAVIGGGNAGFGTASELLAYAKSVTLFEYGDTFKAEKITVEKILKNPKMRALSSVELVEIKGDKFVSGLVYKDRKSGEMKEMPIGGIFVEIGAMPATDFAKGLLNINDFGQIVVDPKTQRTSLLGVWSAGDCTDVLYHQNNIAVGDAVKALEDIYIWLGKN